MKLRRLSDNHTCYGFLCTNHFHAFTIRCTQGKWVLLDTNLSHPVEILDDIPIQMLGGMQLPYRLYKLHGQNPLTPPYMENREKAFCLVHAFNMALGKQLITGNSVLSHARNLENWLTARLNEVNIAKNGACSTPRLNLQQFYSPTSGNFSTFILNHFLHHQEWNIEMYYLKYVNQDMTKGQITPKLIEDIVSVAAYKGAVLLITKNHRNQRPRHILHTAPSGCCWTLKTATLLH